METNILIEDIEEKDASLRRNSYKEKFNPCSGEIVGQSSVNDRLWRLKEVNQEIPEITIRSGKVPECVSEIIMRRGVDANDIANWIEPSFSNFMPNPSLLTNMDKATDILYDAIINRKKIGIVGDYDVDGATSTAIMVRYFRELGLKDVDGKLTEGDINGGHRKVIDPDKYNKHVRFHIPQRMSEGYGTSTYAVDEMHDWKADILLILDSGTLSFDIVDYAKSKGMTVVIVDHHDPKEVVVDGNTVNTLPNADAIVNPKLLGDKAQLSHLCTAGLAFMLVVSLNRKLKNEGFFINEKRKPVEIQMLLGLVALGTIADLMKLETLNRAFVASGLKYMQYIPGIVALRDILNTKQKEKYGTDKDGNVKYAVQYNETACGFSFGPCINACGRISDSSLGTRLLVSEDINEVNDLANLMYHTNETRKNQEKDIRTSCENNLKEREEYLLRNGYPEDNVIVLYDKTWHPGIVGIVASRIKDKYFKPTVIIGEKGKGSARSFETFDIGLAFREASEKVVDDQTIIKVGGGHLMAAGLTMYNKDDIVSKLSKKLDEVSENDIDAEVDNILSNFRDFLNQQAQDFKVPDTQVDIIMPLCDLKVSEVEAFSMLAPFGQANRNPEVLITNCYVSDVKAGSADSVRGKLKDEEKEISFINFGIKDMELGKTLRKAVGHYVKVKGHLEINNYGGKKIQIKVNDIQIEDKVPGFSYGDLELSDSSFL